MKFAIIGIIVLGLAACGSPSGSETAPATADTPAVIPASVELTPAQQQNARLEIGKAERRRLGGTLNINGFMEAPPQNLVSVSFPLGGYLRQVRLLPGMQVRRGEVLATLEDPQYVTLQQDFLTAKTRLEYLSADLARQETLNRDQSASDKALQLARAEYQSELIASKALAEKLRLIGLDPDRLSPEAISGSVPIRAPISGYVTAVNVNAGKYVTPTDVLFELVDNSDLHLTLRAFEKDLPVLRAGLRVTAWASADPAKRYTGRILLVNPKVGAERSAEVHCHLDGAVSGLLPGMFMSAAVEAADRDVVAVPDAAVVRYQNRHYVFLAGKEASFEVAEVEPGESENGYTEIRSANAEALLTGNIVVKNAYTLLMKMKNTEE